MLSRIPMRRLLPDFDPLSPASGAGPRLAVSAALLAALWVAVAWAMASP